MRKLSSGKGTTLLKLVTALLFTTVLAGCTNSGNPTSTNNSAVTQRKQMEAKGILQQIYFMELAYHQDHDLYWPYAGPVSATASTPNELETIGITIPPFTRYTYTILGGFNTFDALATSTVLDDDATIDQWYINDVGQLLVISDDATD